MSDYESKPTEEQKERAKRLLERHRTARYHPRSAIDLLELSATPLPGHGLSPLDYTAIENGLGRAVDFSRMTVKDLKRLNEEGLL